MSLTFAQLEQRFDASFRPEKAVGVDSLFQYVIPDGSNFHMRIQCGNLHFAAGDIADPDLTVSMEWQTLESLFEGRTSAMQAFMFGQIRVQGSLALASRLMAMFTP